MALKPTRRPLAPENHRFVLAGPAEQGAALILGVQPSGAAVGVAHNEAAPVATTYVGAPPSGAKFVGVALDNVVNFDPSRTPRTSFPPTTRRPGEPVAVAEYYELHTNMVVGNPTAETPAFLAADSKFGTTAVSGLPAVGTWKSAKDADGYALLQIKVL
jgi:hypothetical protein